MFDPARKGDPGLIGFVDARFFERDELVALLERGRTGPA
jgi:hypothetical protein